jgi:hypothetical protein
MSVITRIKEARRAHEALRFEPARSANLDEKAPLYRRVKAVLDELWSAAGLSGSVDVLRTAIRRLIVDAEYFAGLTDGEGFRDATEVWDQYELLERAFAGDASPTGQNAAADRSRDTRGKHSPTWKPQAPGEGD